MSHGIAALLVCDMTDERTGSLKLQVSFAKEPYKRDYIYTMSVRCDMTHVHCQKSARFLLHNSFETRCNTLQHAATRCNTPIQQLVVVFLKAQHAATRCNTLQHTCATAHHRAVATMGTCAVP